MKVKRHIWFSFLLILSTFVIFVLAGNETCDSSDCQLLKHNIQIKSHVRRTLLGNGNHEDSSTGEALVNDPSEKDSVEASQAYVCDVQGIDTSPSTEPFRFFKPEDGIDKQDLLSPGGVCDCSKQVQGYKHAVVKKTFLNKTTTLGDHQNIWLVDAYVKCGSSDDSDAALEALLFDYIKNVPERTLGKFPQLEVTSQDCLDENGFKPDNLPGDVPCFSYIIAASVGTYNNTKLLEGEVNYYSGPYSVNRINQNQYIRGDSSQYYSMLGKLHSLGHTCHAPELQNGMSDHCHTYFDNHFYSFICCCLKNPNDCSFKTYKNSTLICAQGSFKYDFASHDAATLKDVIAKSPETMNADEFKKQSLKAFCTSEYTLTANEISYQMPASDLKACNAAKGSEGYCLLGNKVPPTKLPNPASTTIRCCCRTPDLCNVDFVKTKAVDRIKWMSENHVCEQAMIFSVVFAGNSYTHKDDDKIPLCNVHYDPHHPQARYFLADNNMDLVREGDAEVYRTEGCNVIAVKIRQIVLDFKDEGYTEDDTKIPRPLTVCTCKGAEIMGPSTKDKSLESFCDHEVSKNMPKKYEEIKDTLMPRCLVTSQDVDNFKVTTTFEEVMENSNVEVSTKSIFCYSLLKLKDGNVDSMTAKYSLSAGIASVENNFGIKCYDLYQKRQSAENLSKPFCDVKFENGQLLCCMDALGKQPIELLDVVKSQLAANKILTDHNAISEFYHRFKDLRCGEEKCHYPLGCYWTEFNVGETVKHSYGCIENIPKLMAKNSTDPRSRALRACHMFSRQRQLKKLHGEAPKWNTHEPYRCMATNEINKAESADDIDSFFFVCCCTEIDENGECKKKDHRRPVIGQKIKDVISNYQLNLPKDHMYPIP